MMAMTRQRIALEVSHHPPTFPFSSDMGTGGQTRHLREPKDPPGIGFFSEEPANKTADDKARRRQCAHNGEHHGPGFGRSIGLPKHPDCVRHCKSAIARRGG